MEEYKTVKLREAFAYYLQLDRSESTLKKYRLILAPLVREIGPGRPIAFVRPEELDAYVADLRNRRVRYAEHPRRPAEEGPLSTATINGYIKTIRAFFNWCVERGYLEQSPARFLHTRRFSRPLGQGKAATPEEVRRIIAAAHKPRDRAVVYLLAQSGCRAGEVASLRLEHLDLEHKRAVVDGKGDKRRVIVFGPETAEAISAWLQVRPPVAHTYVFTSTRGLGPLDSQSVSLIVRRLSKRAGLERTLGAHAFRHFVGMQLARERVPPTVIQNYLGHSSIATTMGYLASVNETDLHNASRLLSFAPTASEETKKRPGNWSSGGVYEKELRSKVVQNTPLDSRGGRI